MSNDFKFDTELQSQPNYNHTGIDIRFVNDYSFMTQTYDGSGGYKDGTFLLPYSREAFYEDRKKLSAYRNFLKPIVDAVVDPVFSRVIIRKTNNKLFEAFLNDVDNKGTNINSHVNDAMTLARLHGVVFIVMDNFTDLPQTEEQSIQQRKFPYVKIQPAFCVHSYSTDDFDRLTEITFKNNTTYEDKPAILLTTWDSVNLTKTIVDQIPVAGRKPKVLFMKQYQHNLGVLPVISVYATDNDEILPMPPFYSIARTSYSIFQKDSEIRDQERAQAFSVFYIQTDTENNSFVLGPHNAIVIPASDQINITPGYVSPDPSILAQLGTNTNDLVNSLFTAAEQQGIVGVQKANSGIAASYKFIGINSQLQMTASIAAAYEHSLASLFGRYIGSDFDYEVQYPTTFEPVVSPENIDNVIKMLGMDLPEEIKVEIKSMLVRQFLNHLDYDRLEELTDLIVVEPIEIPEVIPQESQQTEVETAQ